MKKSILLVLLGCSILFAGCYKVHRSYIIKGKWYLNSFEIDGGSANQMHGFLEDYVPSDGTYVIYMLDNGIMRGEYYTADTINYFTTGTWSLIDTKTMQMDMDQFVDGDFHIELIDQSQMLLNTSANQIDFFNIGEVKTVLRISREGKVTS
jgi:hypothetical protein